MRSRRVIIVNGSRAPTIYDLPFQDAADLAGGAPFRDMLRDENINEIVDTICGKPSPRLSLLRSGVSPFDPGRKDPLGLVSGDMQGDAAVWSDGVLAKARTRAGRSYRGR